MRVGNIKSTKACALPDTVEQIVVAMCRDYKRRAEGILSPETSARTKVEYRYLNYKIADAVAELVERRNVPIFIDEIGSHTGYASSAAVGMSESVYKRAKVKIKYNIALKLHLFE